VLSGIAFGFSQAVIFWIWGMSFYYGAWLVTRGVTTFNDVLRSIAAVLLSGIIIGQSTQLAPDVGKARLAAAAIFTLYDRVPPIDSSSPEGRVVDHVEGQLDLKDVVFAYPSRPNAPVLTGLTLHVPPGSTLALVGPSGTGGARAWFGLP